MAIGDGNRGKSLGGGAEQILTSARGQAPQQLFDLAPHVFNRVKVWRIRRQIPQPGTGGRDRLANPNYLVGGQFIQNYQSWRLQCGPQALAHPCEKHLAIHGPVKQLRSARSAQTHGGDERADLIMSGRNMGRSLSPTAGRPPKRVSSVFAPLSSTNTRRRRVLLIDLSANAPSVRPRRAVLLGDAQRFLSLNPNRCSHKSIFEVRNGRSSRAPQLCLRDIGLCGHQLLEPGLARRGQEGLVSE